MSFINVPLGYVLKWISGLFNGNFALAVLVFTLLINLILLPLSIHSQKATAKQARMRPKLALLKKKYGDDRNKLMQEQQALNQQSGAGPSASGCLPLIIRLIIMFAVYDVITGPLQYIAGVESATINDALCAAQNFGLIENISNRGSQINLFNLIQNGSIEVSGISPEILSSVNFNLFGINLTETPTFGWNIFKAFDPLWLIPIVSFLTSILSSVVSMLINKRNNPDAPSMAGMMLAMPFFSLIIAFSVPGAVGFYWAASNLISGGLQSAIQLIYGPDSVMAKQQLSGTVKRYATECEQIKKSTGNE